MGTAQGRTFSCDQCICTKGINDCQSARKSDISAGETSGSGQRNPKKETGILGPTAKKAGYRMPPPLQDKRTLLLALKKTNGITLSPRPENSFPEQCGWTPKEDARLEAAVKTVSTSKQILLPSNQVLTQCFKNGAFQDHASRDYWTCVSGTLQSRDAAACFQRYHHLRGLSVARFAVSPRRISGGGSQ